MTSPVIATLWAEMQCPPINGIIYPDDSVKLVVPSPQPRSPGSVALVVGERAPFRDWDKNDVSALVEGSRCRVAQREVLVGEGSWGGDGFIAVTGLRGQLEWIAFFDFSNPFVSVRVDRDLVTVTNNLGERWSLGLFDPDAVTIVVSSS